MLLLVFQIGEDRYALDASRVIEVLPLLQLKKIPGAPRGVAGIFNYRGRPVPAVDVCGLLLGHPARESLTTRIVVVPHERAEQTRLLGLIVENATQVIRRKIETFVDPQLPPGAPPFLGPVLAGPGGMVQLVREEKLLTDEMRDVLFAAAP